MFLFPCLVSAQNNVYVINESFDGTSLPTGWFSMGNGINNWFISQSNICGGKPNEARLSWSPPFNGVSRLVSTPVDLTDVSSAVLALKHYPSFFGMNQAIVGVATSSDNGSTWNSVWSEQYNANGAYSILENITSPDMGKGSVLFCIYFEGNSSAISDWYFDDFEVYTIEDISVELTSIDIPAYIKYGNHEISFTIKNTGNAAIQTIKASYTIDGDKVEQTFYANVPSMEYQQFTFNTDFAFEANKKHELSVEITSVNDSNDDNSDNALSMNVTAAMSQTQRTPMIEHFSSSSCGPCVEVNSIMEDFTNDNAGKFTYVKYPLNFPGAGDPYYTSEAGVRKSLYDVTGVPQIFFDGIFDISYSIEQEELEAKLETPAIANIRGSFNMDGNTINITADFMSYIDMNNMKAFISVNEKTTTENVSSNGETEFHHIMMKMLDNAEGNDLNITAGEYKRFEFSFDMSSTHVEDINDLEVALWLQDIESKEIINSRFAYEYTEHVYPVQNMTLEEGGSNYLVISWEAPQNDNASGYNIYVNNELVAENISELSYQHPLSEAGFYVVEVVALYDDKSSVGVVKTIDAELNINENTDVSINIYPNPAKDLVKLSVVSSQYSAVRIYNVLGIMVDEIEMNSNEIEINVSEYKSGIYFINAETSNGNIVKKMIVE